MNWLFERYYAALCGYAKRYTSSISIAEEVVGDVMLKVWKNRHNGYRTETFREYLFVATRYTALNYLNQQSAKQQVVDTWAEQLRHELIEETPLDRLLDAELKVYYEKLLHSLPEQSRTAFLLSREEGLSYEEIAQQMGISVNTVKYHIKVALQKIRIGLNDYLTFLLFIHLIN